MDNYWLELGMYMFPYLLIHTLDHLQDFEIGLSCWQVAMESDTMLEALEQS